jgi:hypothetical protein
MAQITTTREDAVETLVGTFRPPPGFELGDEIDLSSWRFHCPGCGTWGFLNAKQWAGQAKFNHKPDGCPGKYNEIRRSLPGSIGCGRGGSGRARGS